VDVLISLSNAMLSALRAGFPTVTVWDTLRTATENSGNLGLAMILVMIAFVVIAVMLLIYYVGRLLTLYLGAALSPIVALLWILPATRDFATGLVKRYLVTIFILFVHIVILQLATSFFAGMVIASGGTQTSPLMSMAVGIAALVALLKVEGVTGQYMAAATAPRAMRQVARQISATTSKFVGGAKAANNSAAGKAVKSGAVTVTKKGASAAAKGASVAARETKKGAAAVGTAAILGTASPVVQRSVRQTKSTTTSRMVSAPRSSTPIPKTSTTGKGTSTRRKKNG